MYSSGSITYESKMGIVMYVWDGDEVIFDPDKGIKVPDLRERWEANGLEYDEEYWAKPRQET